MAPGGHTLPPCLVSQSDYTVMLWKLCGNAVLECSDGRAARGDAVRPHCVAGRFWKFELMWQCCQNVTPSRIRVSCCCIRCLEKVACRKRE